MRKLRVRLSGFDSAKTAEVHRLLPAAIREIDKILGRRGNYPTPVRPMSNREMTTRREAGQAHVGKGGRGVYDPRTNEIRVNPFLSSEDLLHGVVQELMHATLRGLPEEEIDRLADQVMGKLRLTEKNNSLMHKISESLSSKTLKRLRKMRRGKKKPESATSKYFPGLMGNDVPPYSVTGTLPGPGSFGPVSVGGIIRHS